MAKRLRSPPSTAPTPANYADRFTAVDLWAAHQLVQLSRDGRGSGGGGGGGQLAAEKDVDVIREQIPPPPEDVLMDQAEDSDDEESVEPLKRAKERYRLISDIYANGPAPVGRVLSAAPRGVEMVEKMDEEI